MTHDLRSPNSPRGTTLAHARWADPVYVAEKSYKLLLLQMEHNPVCHGAIARYARDMLQSSAQHVRYFESVRSSAVEHLRFLEGQGIINTVSAATAGAAWPRTFRVADLKDKHISVFLCLPEHNYDPLDRWLRAMIEILIGGMQERQGLGANGERVLFCIDEFANLGRMDSIAKASNSIAGAGVKLMIPQAGRGMRPVRDVFGAGFLPTAASFAEPSGRTGHSPRPKRFECRSYS